MKRFLLPATCFSLVLCLSWATLAQAQAFEHGAWDGLVKRHVRPIRGGEGTQVDYAGMARVRNLLKGYLDGLASVPEADFRPWPRPHSPCIARQPRNVLRATPSPQPRYQATYSVLGGIMGSLASGVGNGSESVRTLGGPTGSSIPSAAIFRACWW